MEKALSDQMNKEIHASHVFLSYGIWADDKGYQGIANFLYRHAQEERNHSIKFMEYILNSHLQNCRPFNGRERLGNVEFYAMVCTGTD